MTGGHGDRPLWVPDRERIARSQVTRLAAALALASYTELHAFSIAHPQDYWKGVLAFLGVRWSRP